MQMWRSHEKVKIPNLLTGIELRLVVQCLLDLRSVLVVQGKYTDGVDEIIIVFAK